MEPQEFLAAVLPPPGHGYYCVAAITPKRKEHHFAQEIEEVLPKTQQWLGERKDVYFALSTFREQGSREAVNAAYISPCSSTWTATLPRRRQQRH